MLKIIFGDTDEAIFNTDVYFNNTYKSEWITTPLAREIIKDVDCSEVQGPYSIYSPALGGTIPIERLSGGVKTLLLLINDDSNIFNVSTCGDNCAKWVLKIAEQKDITINLLHIMNFGDDDFKAVVVNDDTEIHNYDEYISEAIKYV